MMYDTEKWRAAYERILGNRDAWEISTHTPFFVSETFETSGPFTSGSIYKDGPTFWIFKDHIYQPSLEEDFDHDQWQLLVREEFDRERRYFERLKSKFHKSGTTTTKRVKIPSDVRIFVWQRDGGKCTECGSQQRLEYDHIIPIAKGGSNTERNIQLLCEGCNRRKSDHIQ